MAPTRVRVAEPLAFLAPLADVALTIREGGKVGGINRYVPAKIRVLSAERCREGIQSRNQDRPIRLQLVREAVHRPNARASAQSVLQARMLGDQSCNPRPGGKCEQRLDEASAD